MSNSANTVQLTQVVATLQQLQATQKHILATQKITLANQKETLKRVKKFEQTLSTTQKTISARISHLEQGLADVREELKPKNAPEELVPDDDLSSVSDVDFCEHLDPLERYLKAQHQLARLRKTFACTKVPYKIALITATLAGASATNTPCQDSIQTALIPPPTE
ncbi:hypothetical protein H2201_003279 [Coniosporium apollinis]|uniref:Uncharacterized protein n=1 Tax=Coniosporium apollinis TaxID=61459 RepID=A0ABQ9NW65_9PEZI|nr:hypothetical protein H2201_003279 [Coniosporium apollinis]